MGRYAVILTYLVLVLVAVLLSLQSVFLYRFRKSVLLSRSATYTEFSREDFERTEGLICGRTALSISKTLGARLGKVVVLDVRDRTAPRLVTDVHTIALPPVHSGRWQLKRTGGHAHYVVDQENGGRLAVQLRRSLRHQVPSDMWPRKRFLEPLVTLDNESPPGA